MKLSYKLKSDGLHFKIIHNNKNYIGKGTTQEMFDLIKKLKEGK